MINQSRLTPVISNSLIHIQWEGPLPYDEAKRLVDEHADYGVYQIYGAHPVYGSDVLLYIGRANSQTFGIRLRQEYWNYHNQDAARVCVYVGRLSGYAGTPTDEEWARQISLVERLLIYSHWPAGNSSGLNVEFSEDFQKVQVLNWGKYRDLLPEVSGARYSRRYESDDGYEPYGTDRVSDRVHR